MLVNKISQINTHTCVGIYKHYSIQTPGGMLLAHVQYTCALHGSSASRVCEQDFLTITLYTLIPHANYYDIRIILIQRLIALSSYE